MKATSSIDAVRTVVAQAEHRARAGHSAIVNVHNSATEQAKAVAKNRELRLDAVASRQASLRAKAGLEAVAHLKDAHATLHTITKEAKRRALPTTPSDAGEAIRQRSEVEEFFRLEEGRQGELLRTDQRMREVLLGSGNRFDIERARAIPTIDFDAITEQARREYSPLLMDLIDKSEREAKETLKAASRVIAAGLTGEQVQVAGLHPSHRTGDVASRYQNLPADWNPDTDPVFQADLAALEARTGSQNMEKSA
jgi:hypothetical protein